MKNKHLTYENRKLIEKSLNNNLNFTKIGLTINKPYKTISNEVKRNKIAEYDGAVAWCHQKPCKNNNKPTYVCNGCSKRNICTLNKHLYDYTHSFKEHKDNLCISLSNFFIIILGYTHYLTKNQLYLIVNKSI